MFSKLSELKQLLRFNTPNLGGVAPLSFCLLCIKGDIGLTLF